MQEHFLFAPLAFGVYSVTVGQCCRAALTLVLRDRQIMLPACLFEDELHPPLDSPYWLFKGTGKEFPLCAWSFNQAVFICS